VKILYLCHRFPFPPKRGGKIRPFNMIKHLAARHEVTVASLARSPHEAREGAGIAEYCSRYEIFEVRKWLQVMRMLVRVATPTPSSMGFFFSPTLGKRVQQWLANERFDLVFVHCSSVAQYVASVQDVPKILDFGDMDSQKWLEYARYKAFPLSAGYWLEGKKVAMAEKRLAGMFDLCTTTTRAEWQTLESYGTGAATDWFPNGVDADYFAPSGEGYGCDEICFVGRMDYYPNQACMLAFCADVWPRIRERRPDARLAIVGADPSAAIRRLGTLPGVIVTGSVKDVRPYLLRSAVMVAPLSIARGTQNKLLEAMACGIPVVTSSIAAGGVDAIAGTHLLVADTPADVAAATLSLMDDPGRRDSLARAGRARVLTHHAWPESMSRLDTIIDNCVTRFAPRSAERTGLRRKAA